MISSLSARGGGSAARGGSAAGGGSAACGGDGATRGSAGAGAGTADGPLTSTTSICDELRSTISGRPAKRRTRPDTRTRFPA
ncbi:MAG: hypothetical protein E6J56_13945 [Deltaproteobacteria bacterium]|nr:MAG: hypothetical protein E6J56_13945 [Deltaproteobacteria bacterium]